MHLFLFADIYGFSALAERDPSSVMTKLNAVAAKLSNLCLTYNSQFSIDFKHFMMSDNVMVLIELDKSLGWEEKRKVWGHLIGISREIYVEAFNLDLPLRGCITCGEIASSPTHIVGKPVTDAVKTEMSFPTPLIFVPKFTLDSLNQDAPPSGNLNIEMQFIEIPFQEGILSVSPVLPLRDRLNTIRNKALQNLENHLSNPKLSKSALGWRIFIDITEKWIADV